MKACDGPRFVDRRDMAIVRLFIDSGMRLSELANLRVLDVDLDDGVALVVGKGARPRACPFGAKTTSAIDRYLRIRSAHRETQLPALWLGVRGGMTPSGIRQVVQDRSAKAGLGSVKPHALRHSFAHAWLIQGGTETDLMKIAAPRSAANGVTHLDNPLSFRTGGLPAVVSLRRGELVRTDFCRTREAQQI